MTAGRAFRQSVLKIKKINVNLLYVVNRKYIYTFLFLIAHPCLKILEKEKYI
jgi:hypothetical protein